MPTWRSDTEKVMLRRNDFCETLRFKTVNNLIRHRFYITPYTRRFTDNLIKDLHVFCMETRLNVLLPKIKALKEENPSVFFAARTRAEFSMFTSKCISLVCEHVGSVYNRLAR